MFQKQRTGEPVTDSLEGRNVSKGKKSEKIPKKENPESDHCCGGDRNIRSGGLQESETVDGSSHRNRQRAADRSKE